MAARFFSLHDALRAVTNSDSDDDDVSEADSSCNDSEGTVEADSNEEGDAEESSSESDHDSPPRRRRRVVPPPPVEPQQPVDSQFLGRNNHVWVATPPVPTQTRAANVLRQQRGLKAAAEQCSEIVDSFSLFMTQDMLLLMVRETNRRARVTTREWNDSNPNQHTWSDTDETELKAMIGLLIMAGVWRSAGECLDELWSAKDGRPIFRAVMSLQRFNELLRYCRFDNQETRQQRVAEDKLAPIRDFWEMFLSTLPPVYKPGSDMTIDEQLVATRGRCPFRQYIPSKPGKYGIKIFWLCDSETSYPLKGEIYVGKQPNAPANANNVRDLVKRLVRPWMNSGRNVTMDNYFTSVALAGDLLAARTTVVGTMRKNIADIPLQMLANRQRPELSSIFGFDHELTLVSYVPKKNKAVILLSSMHHDAVVDINQASKPEIILHYNETKSGVDNLDHLVRSYTCKRKIKRWPMTIFFNIVDCAAVAGYVVWCTKFPDWNAGKKDKRRMFLKDLALALVEGELQRRSQNPQAVQRQVKLAFESLGRPVEQPTVVFAAPPKASNRNRCSFCPRGNDKKVSTFCSRCNHACCRVHGQLVCEGCLGDLQH